MSEKTSIVSGLLMQNNHSNEENIKQSGSQIFADIVFFIVIAAVVAMVFNPVLFTGGDNAYYISLSHSILEDHTYRINYRTDQPLEVSIPPGYPILLVIVQLFFGNSILAMKILSYISFLIALYFGHLILLQFGLKRYITFPFVLFLALQPLINEYASFVLTEAPFMAFSFAGAFFLERYIRSERDWKGLILPALLLAFSVMIRIPAGALLPAAFFYILFRKGFKKTAIFTGIVSIIVLPWLIWMFAAPSSNSFIYLKNFTKDNVLKADSGEMTSSTLLSRIPKNQSIYLFNHFPQLLIPQIAYNQTPRWLDIGLGVIIGIFLLFGLFHCIRKKHYFLLIYLLLYGMILTFNHSARLRYIVVIVPFIVLLFYFALTEILSLLKKHNFTFIALGLILASLVGFSGLQYFQKAKLNLQILNRYSLGEKYVGLHPVWTNYIEAALWVRDNTDDDIFLCARKPRISYLLSHRKSRVFIYHDDPAAVVTDLLENEIDYIIIDRIRAETPQYLVPAINSRQDLFKICYTTDEPETYVIEVLKPQVEPVLSSD